MNGCVITYLDAIHSFILNAMRIAGTLKYLNLLPYGVFSRLHLSRKRLGETMGKVSNLKDAKYGRLVHVSHIQDSNGKWYKTN